MEKIKKLIAQHKETVKAQVKEIAPAFGLALLIVILAVISADVFYRQKPLVKRGYQIEISVDGKVVKKEEKPVDLSTMMKTADAARGEKIFKKCASCHTVGKGEGAKVGPNLFGILGKKRASFAGFSYSEAMKTKGGAWDKESVNQFITKPKDFLPGTKMAFPGLKKPQDRADVILFLERNR